MTAVPAESDQFFNGVTMEWTLRFVWPESAFTVNWALNHHHTSVSREIKAWREPFRLMALGCAPLAWCSIVVDHVVPTRRSVDPGAAFLAYKAALDGIVLAGVLEDDSPHYVRSVTFNAPTYEKGRDALIVTLKGPAAGRFADADRLEDVS